MHIWEYCTVSYSSSLHKIEKVFLDGEELISWREKPLVGFLNFLGKEGWEMSGCDTSGMIFFKRKILAHPH